MRFIFRETSVFSELLTENFQAIKPYRQKNVTRMHVRKCGFTITSLFTTDNFDSSVTPFNFCLGLSGWLITFFLESSPQPIGGFLVAQEKKVAKKLSSLLGAMFYFSRNKLIFFLLSTITKC